MSKYKIVAVAVDLTVNPPHIGIPRDEVIDTETNPLFADCETVRAIEYRYEGFWNHLNFDDIVHRPAEKIKVLSVERIEGEAPESSPSDVQRIMFSHHAKSQGDINANS